jgi:hypothetical protein
MCDQWAVAKVSVALLLRSRNPIALLLLRSVLWSFKIYMMVLELALNRKGPTRVNSGDNRVRGNSSVNLPSHGHCAGVFIGT